MYEIKIQFVFCLDPDKNFHYVVDCERQVMKEHCYWPIVSDLNNVLSHKPIAVRFMSDDTLLEMWFDFLSMFQGILYVLLNIITIYKYISMAVSYIYCRNECESARTKPTR